MTFCYMAFQIELKQYHIWRRSLHDDPVLAFPFLRAFTSTFYTGSFSQISTDRFATIFETIATVQGNVLYTLNPSTFDLV